MNDATTTAKPEAKRDLGPDRQAGLKLAGCAKCGGAQIICIIDNHVEIACIMCGKLQFLD